MSDDLKTDLQEISGVGSATADAIMDVLQDHDTGRDPYLDMAMNAADDGNDHAAIAYLQRAGGDD